MSLVACASDARFRSQRGQRGSASIGADGRRDRGIASSTSDTVSPSNQSSHMPRHVGHTSISASPAARTSMGDAHAGHLATTPR